MVFGESMELEMQIKLKRKVLQVEKPRQLKPEYIQETNYIKYAQKFQLLEP